MCKRNEMIGSCLMTLGAGLVLSLFFRSDFVLCLLGAISLVGGVLYCRKR